MQVVVSGPKNRYFHLTRSLKRIGKFVGRGSRRSIAEAVCKNESLRSQVVLAMSRIIRKEILDICSQKHDSILRLKSRPALERFTWERVWSEFQSHAPMLLTMLSGAIASSAIPFRPPLCVAACILVKLSNPRVNLVQSILSLILKTGQATKLVCLTWWCEYNCV